jgi:copper chaperone CopZ
MKTMNLRAEGIMCTGCAQDLETVLRETRGVQDASVSYKEETVRVLYDPGIIKGKEIFLMVARMGFRPKIIQGAAE